MNLYFGYYQNHKIISSLIHYNSEIILIHSQNLSILISPLHFSYFMHPENSQH
jgi:hypothetical protein